MGRDRNIPNTGDLQTFDGLDWRPISLAGVFALMTLVNFIDTILSIIDDADSTKTLKFQVGTQATGSTLTMDVGAQTASRTLLVPVLTGSDTLAALGIDNTFTGNLAQTGAKTFSTGTGAVSLNGVTTVNQTTAVTVLTISDNVSGSQGDLRIKGGLNHYNYQIGANDLVNNALTITPSTATNGTTFSTPAVTIDGATGNITLGATTDASAIGTAANVVVGGQSIAKTLISAKGLGQGITATATAASTTVLAQGSTNIQTFTGATTQNITMPAANLWGAGIAVTYRINNQSSGTVTPTRAGSDTFQGGGTTSAVLAGASQDFCSDGVSIWLKC